MRANNKFERRRLEILRSAAKAFGRHGFYGSSVDDIAHALHMNKANLYYYFRNKEEILYFCHDYSLDLLLKILKDVEAGGSSPEEKVRKLVVTFVHVIIDELHGTGLTQNLVALSRWRLRKIIAKRDEFDRGLRRILKEGIRSGVFRKNDRKLLTFAILGAINWIPRWFDPRGRASSEEIATTFADYLVAGLMAPDHASANGDASTASRRPANASRESTTRKVLSRELVWPSAHSSPRRAISDKKMARRTERRA
jgi:AcrR family transcriptional regulator